MKRATASRKMRWSSPKIVRSAGMLRLLRGGGASLGVATRRRHTLRPHHEHKTEQRENRDILIGDAEVGRPQRFEHGYHETARRRPADGDRKSKRLNSSH